MSLILYLYVYICVYTYVDFHQDSESHGGAGERGYGGYAGAGTHQGSDSDDAENGGGESFLTTPTGRLSRSSSISTDPGLTPNKPRINPE